jgi:ribose transport system ATP-binding protein
MKAVGTKFPEAKTIIVCEDIAKYFPGVKALDGVSFDIREGEVHSLCGENGAGVSCVYQELSIAPQLDIAKNLFIGNLPMKGGLVDHKTLYKRAAEILDELDMHISPKTIAGDLSVGQQQMIEIGRALTRNARVIIMDEPTSSLSETETETLFQVIHKLTARNIAVVYISHKLDEVMELSDRITVIRDGKNIISKDKTDFTQNELIANMIGRPLQNLSLKEPAEITDVMLDVRKLKGGDPSAAIRAGVGFCTEDRKKEGLALKLQILLNMTLVRLPFLSKLGVIQRKEQRTAADKYMESISIKAPSVQQLVGNLSGGNQQKVVVAKWLMMDPKVLIVDEPTRGIDVGSKSEIYGLLSDLAKQGMAIVVVSSEIEEIMGVCDSVITIYEGKKTAQLKITPELTREKVLSCALGAVDESGKEAAV